MLSSLDMFYDMNLKRAKCQIIDFVSYWFVTVLIYNILTKDKK